MLFGFDVLNEIVCDMIVNVCDLEGYFDLKGIFFVRKVIE